MNLKSLQTRYLNFEKTPLFTLLLQGWLCVALLLIATGGVGLLGWENLKPIRDGYRFLMALIVLLAAFLAARAYGNHPYFIKLEPVATLKKFFDLPPIYSVSILYLCYLTTQWVHQISMHYGMETALWDFGFYDQILWNTAHDGFLITSVRGGLHLFCEHFKPMLIALSWIYKFTDSQVLFLLITTALSSTTLIAGYLVARELTRSHSTALVMMLALFFYQPLRNGIDFLYHSQTLADPLLLFGFWFALREKWGRSLWLFSLALACKENIALDVMGVGLFLISQKKRFGWTVFLLGLTMLLTYALYIEPKYRYPFHAFKKTSIFGVFLSPSWETFKGLLTPNPIAFLILIFGPWLFLSFRCKGWQWLLGLSLGARLFSSFAPLRTIDFHYTAGVNALIFISAVYGLAGLKSGAEKYQDLLRTPKKWLRLLGNKQAAPILLFICALLFAGNSQLFKIDKYLWWASAPANQQIIRILESIPPQYSVMTNERFSSHLSHRRYLFVFKSMFAHAPLVELAKKPDLIIFDNERAQDPERVEMENFKARGYINLFSHGVMQIYSVRGSPSATLNTQWQRTVEEPIAPYRNFFKGFLILSVLTAVAFFILNRWRYKSLQDAA